MYTGLHKARVVQECKDKNTVQNYREAEINLKVGLISTDTKAILRRVCSKRKVNHVIGNVFGPVCSMS